jgi:hypothetical protein
MTTPVLRARALGRRYGAYAGFYLAAAVWIESRGASSAHTALALGALWVATTLVLPVLASAAVGALRPLPSRIEAIDAERSAQLDRRRDGDRLLARFYEDHPELRKEPGAEDDFTRFLTQVAAFDTSWRDYWLPLVVSSTPVTSSYLAERPGFAFAEEPASARWGRPLLAIGLLAAASILLALLARARLRRADRTGRGDPP